jgi:hypothetical protein
MEEAERSEPENDPVKTKYWADRYQKKIESLGRRRRA